MVNEKLVNDDVFAILEQLCIVEFGEHNILIYNEQGGLAVVVDKSILPSSG